MIEDLSGYGAGVVPLHGPRWGPGVDVSASAPAASQPLGEVSQSLHEDRLASGILEVDRVLGGGLLAGSVTLLGGDPGIGKSTLVLQLLERMTSEDIASKKGKALYISGEESAAQIKARAERLGCVGLGVNLMAEVEVERMLGEIERLSPSLVVVDSIQTVRTMELESSAGNVSQVRACAAALIELAKRRGVAVILVGHVTKEGALAGPRTLEHMVDVVLYLEGEEERPQRILRSVKNRFGASHEVGLFTMTEKGLHPVESPSSLFLGERVEGAAGTVVMAAMEGTRPLLIEIQALVGENTTSQPRRTAVGVDPNRLALLQAIIEKHLGDALAGLDIFVNVVGGLRLNEPALDAAVIAAILSSFRNTPIEAKTVVFGEVGLTGELRAVRHAPERLAEAARLGFNHALVPPRQDGPKAMPGLEVIQARNVADLVEHLFTGG